MSGYLTMSKVRCTCGHSWFAHIAYGPAKRGFCTRFFCDCQGYHEASGTGEDAP